MNHQKDEQAGPSAHYAWNITGAQNDKAAAVLLWAPPGKAGFFGKKRIMLGKQKAAGKEEDQIGGELMP